VVARLDRPGFALGSGEIALWLLAALSGAGEPPQRGRSWRHRALERLRLWMRQR
jgi:hypothetical protein